MGSQSYHHSIVKMIKQCALVFALLVVLAEGQRRGGRRRQAPRRGRQEAAGGYAAPDDVPVYAASDAVPTYEAAGDDALAALGNSIPGVPGEDYPIYSEVPESGFSCEGQVDGGYYADPEAECQAFHICTADGAGGLAKYSFLCPNGTLFNQNYFICDWWFNFDCSTAEDLYALNDEIAAEREALAADASNAPVEYGAPIEEEYAAAADYPEYEAVTEAADDYETVAVEELYAVSDLPEEYGAPAEEEYAAAADYAEYEEMTTEAIAVYEAATESRRSARRFRNRMRGRGRRGQNRG